MATFTSVASGNWNAWATWFASDPGGGEGSQYPGEGDTWLVSAGHTVTVNGQYPASLTNGIGAGELKVGTSAIAPGGKLEFSRSANSRLILNHNNLELKAYAILDMGTVASPIPAAYTAELLFNTTSDNAKGLYVPSTATGAVVDMNGSDTFGGVIRSRLQAAWDGSATTIYLKNDVSSKWLDNQWIAIHKGRAYSSYINDLAVAQINGTVTWDGAKSTVPIDNINAPSTATTWLEDGDVIHLSRNVVVGKYNYTKTPGNNNTNRPFIQSSSAATIDLNSCNYTEIGGVANALRVYQSTDKIYSYLTISNSNIGLTNYSLDYGKFTLNNLVAFSNATAISGNCDLNDSYLAGNMYSITRYLVNGNTVMIFGSYYPIKQVITLTDCFVYANYQAIAGISGKLTRLSLGYDEDGIQKNNSRYLIGEVYTDLELKDLYISEPLSTMYSRGLRTNNRCENFNLTVNDNRWYQTYGDCFQRLADGSGVYPDVPADWEQYVIEASAQSTCTTGKGFTVLEHSLYCQADKTINLRYYVQTNYSSSGVGAGGLVLTVSYLDGTTSTSRTEVTHAPAITERSGDTDWSQYLEYEITPAEAGLVNLKIECFEYESGKFIWVSPTLHCRYEQDDFSEEPIITDVIWAAGTCTVVPGSDPQLWSVTETDPAVVGAYTGIAIDHGAGTCEITESHTIAELYDYAQWDWCDSANYGYAQWFSTTDGVNFTSTYDITVDGCDLTGGTSIDVGTGTFTKDNDGTYDGIIIDSDSREVHIITSGVEAGSVVRIYDTTHSDELYNDTVAGDIDVVFDKSEATNITVKVRLFGYLEWTTSVGITDLGNTIVVSQVADPIYAAYTAGIASDFTIVEDTSIDHTAGTTVYTVRDLYNWTMDYFADPTYMANTLPMTAQTQYDYTLNAAYAMDDGTHEYLKTGSITEEGGDVLFANVYTVGSIASGNLYIYQNAIEYTKFWGDGNIDVLLKVKDSGSLIDSGDVTIFCREYGYLFDHYLVNLAGGGRTAVSISTYADVNNTTAALTIAGWVDITVTTGGGPYLHDIGDGDGDCPYTTEVDAGGHSIQDVYEYLKYLTEEGQAESYTTADPAYTEVKQAPYGTFAGGIFFGARGIWVENVAVADALNYVLIDDDNDTHQAPSPPVQLSGTSIVDGSRIQVYDVDDAAELANEVISGTTYSYEYDYGVIGGHTLRIRLTWADGAAYKEEWTTSVLAGESGCSFIATQVDWDGPNAWSIDGSAVTEFAADYPNVQIDADDADGETTKTRLGAWWCYNLTTEDGIANFFGGIEVPAANVIRVMTSIVDLQIQNVSATSLVFTDSDVRLYRDDNTPMVATGTGSIEMDYNGVPDVVYVSTGSGLSTEEHNQLMGLKSAYAWKRTA